MQFLLIILLVKFFSASTLLRFLLKNFLFRHLIIFVWLLLSVMGEVDLLRQGA